MRQNKGLLVLGFGVDGGDVVSVGVADHLEDETEGDR